jgi:hypothetical protein
MEVHLDAGGHAVGEHLGGRGGHGDLDVVGREASLARPHDLGQPAVQGQPLPLTPEQHHRRMGVGVDQPGEEDAGQLDDVGVVRRWRLRRGPDPADPAVGDVEDRVRDHRARPVSDDDGPGGEAVRHGSRTY